VLITKNDLVIAGDPGYDGANEVFEQAGAKLAFVSVDEHGINLNEVEAICKKKKVKLVYVIPHHHSPTTVTLSADRRMQLLELARKYKFAIVEDDYDYDFHYTSSPILPLASVDYYGSVIYVGSFSKTIAPGIRMGFMIAPQNLITQATRFRRLIDRQGEQLLEEAMANLLKNGDISRHLKKANKTYHERRDILCRLLQEKLGGYVHFKIPDGGFAIWMEYLNGLKPHEVAAKASVMGLIISNGSGYFHDPAYPNNYVRIGFASLNPKELGQAVGILKNAIEALAST
jgi:GntR family transcriptional regulator/MocR family aminotransferase